MIWHIAKRELYDNLNSLRFALATALLLALMLTNAVVHLREHPGRIQEYRTSATDYWNALTPRTDLYELAQKGPGFLYKKPSPLRFCAEGGEAFLSNRVDAGYVYWGMDDLKGFWSVAYPSSTPNLTNVRPDVTKIDWGFIVGYVLSLIVLLFTFDSISGERERGTLRLMLANPMPRHIVLIGKFLGALMSILVPFTFAVLINLFVISVSGDVQLDAEAWGRLSIIFIVAVLYTGLFIALGLLVSSRVRQSAVSLVILLLTWVTFVVFMPNTLASIATGFSPAPMTSDEFMERKNQLHNNRWRETYSMRDKPMKLSKFVINDAEDQERLNQEHLTQQIAQVEVARAATRISPAALVQHLLESFAGTGFSRHLQFLENVRQYVRQYREFVIDTDSADPDSPHFIGISEGISRKPVSPESIPRFEDSLSLSRDFNDAAIDLMLLMLLVLVLMSGAYLVFVRAQV
ncbi:MAG: ABC transporter permease subunit [Candidatus Poribacteria bacterium]|nr:ABC transporter permease subunit [Candidatus Poribacteria bacterium]